MILAVVGPIGGDGASGVPLSKTCWRRDRHATRIAKRGADAEGAVAQHRSALAPRRRSAATSRLRHGSISLNSLLELPCRIGLGAGPTSCRHVAPPSSGEESFRMSRLHRSWRLLQMLVCLGLVL